MHRASPQARSVDISLLALVFSSEVKFGTQQRTSSSSTQHHGIWQELNAKFGWTFDHWRMQASDKAAFFLLEDRLA